MSRYPTGMNAAWFPTTVELIAPGERNLYGEIATEGAAVVVKAKVVPTMVEINEGGSRVSMQGASITIPQQSTVPVVIGTLVRWNGRRFTIIGIYGHSDHSGAQHYQLLNVVEKAGEGV
jgi:hypothetical protein